MPWLGCPRCKKIKDDLAEKYLEAARHGEHWMARQRTKSNKVQRLHDELNHVDIEPLVDTFVQMKAQLRELEPSRPSTENLPRIPSFYKPQKYFAGFYLYLKSKNVYFLFYSYLNKISKN